MEFMEKVRAGVIFCPRAENVKCPPVCMTPPPKAVLVDKIDIACAELYKRGEDTSALERLLERMIPPAKKKADTAFLIRKFSASIAKLNFFSRPGTPQNTIL